MSRRASSAREVIAQADALIARVRSRLDARPAVPIESFDTRHAYAIEQLWDDEVERLIRSGAREDAARQFRIRWPALVAWRDRILRPTERGPVPDRFTRAAALELHALEATMRDEPELAARIMEHALRVMGVNRP